MRQVGAALILASSNPEGSGVDREHRRGGRGGGGESEEDALAYCPAPVLGPFRHDEIAAGPWLLDDVAPLEIFERLAIELAGQRELDRGVDMGGACRLEPLQQPLARANQDRGRGGNGTGGARHPCLLN